MLLLSHVTTQWSVWYRGCSHPCLHQFHVLGTMFKVATGLCLASGSCVYPRPSLSPHIFATD